MLNVESLSAGYGSVRILWDVSFRVGEGEIVAILGGNGAGKTTTVRAVTGLIRPTGGSVKFNGQELCGQNSRRILAAGIVQVPEGRQLFTEMTVYENLELGACSREAKLSMAEHLSFVYSRFPKLRDRKNQSAGTLSGGEQQMVAVARALMASPKLLILDEPSLGLAPNVVDDILDVASDMARENGVSIILVEQDVTKALNVADRGYVIENGRVVLEDTAKNLKTNDHVKKAYLGI
ncbi:MAG: ABC transporter ATP-binding protein [Synergistaceae bacterium]|jgi:branched-chain amino acid transport system ATP-binding protein|nr:ABC transporter ATP-binding protein [Synergistaceae bacterium]